MFLNLKPPSVLAWPHRESFSGPMVILVCHFLHLVQLCYIVLDITATTVLSNTIDLYRGIRIPAVLLSGVDNKDEEGAHATEEPNMGPGTDKDLERPGAP